MTSMDSEQQAAQDDLKQFLEDEEQFMSTTGVATHLVEELMSELEDEGEEVTAEITITPQDMTTATVTSSQADEDDVTIRADQLQDILTPRQASHQPTFQDLVQDQVENNLYAQYESSMLLARQISNMDIENNCQQQQYEDDNTMMYQFNNQQSAQAAYEDTTMQAQHQEPTKQISEPNFKKQGIPARKATRIVPRAPVLRSALRTRQPSLNSLPDTQQRPCFRATPMNKKIFEPNYTGGMPRLPAKRKLTIPISPKLHTAERVEARRFRVSGSTTSIASAPQYR